MRHSGSLERRSTNERRLASRQSLRIELTGHRPMAVISAFRALRPTPPAASAVAAVPYDVVSTDEARALAAGNPLSFLHVSRAEIDLPQETDPHADVVYAKAVENFVALKDRAPLVLEEAPSLYVYRLRMGEYSQTGNRGVLFGCRVRRRPHQEARAYPAGQGGRSDAAHHRVACPDRSGISDSRCLARGGCGCCARDRRRSGRQQGSRRGNTAVV